MHTPTNPISGTFAIPAPDYEMLVEEPTSGLEDIVDWDDLEEALLDGIFASKEKVREFVQAQFDTYNAAQPEGTEPATLTRHHYNMVLDGLCNLPASAELSITNIHQAYALKVRAAYEALPERGATTIHQARAIRQQFAEGATKSAIAADFGVSRQTVADVVNNVTWRDVA